MAYSIVGILAIAIHLIVNLDVILNLRHKSLFVGERVYFFFLLAVIAYHVTDGVWGFLYDAKNVIGVIIDTDIYFIAMAASILMWSIFVYQYLGSTNKIMMYVGGVVFAFQMVVIFANFFTPILFVVTEDCQYAAQTMRYVMLGVQVVLFLVLSVYSFIGARKQTESLRRHHYIIGGFSLFMALAIILQAVFPLQPMYSFGYLLGICALHTFVVEEERSAKRQELELAKHQIAIDPLTGVMSKHAYIDIEAEIDDRINKGTMEDFAVVVFDLNDLKVVNDNYGHEEGDQYIIKSVELISDYFKDVPIYRVGGDEFAIILTGDDFINLESLVKNFNHRIDRNLSKGDMIVISAGYSIYDADKDGSILQTFTRADREMYARKHTLKDHNTINA